MLYVLFPLIAISCLSPLLLVRVREAFLPSGIPLTLIAIFSVGMACFSNCKLTLEELNLVNKMKFNWKTYPSITSNESRVIVLQAK